MTTLEKLLMQLDDAQAALRSARADEQEARVAYECQVERVDRALASVASALAALRLHQGAG